MNLMRPLCIRDGLHGVEHFHSSSQISQVLILTVHPINTITIHWIFLVIKYYEKCGAFFCKIGESSKLNRRAVNLRYFACLEEQIRTGATKEIIKYNHKLKYLDNNPFFGSNKNAAPTIRPYLNKIE
ncbi:hypothetical protein BpHYR1_008985 [Brachionus plicatilis]|uniref:Uncharacterized protein n=1 Tax=Brachionus plicatilis TaxID=10195 RepID=A0A3M7RKX1_BRAPC|nr:hypothetical protein BpHYR1_008985 [Brachionus plicatilis]